MYEDLDPQRKQNEQIVEDCQRQRRAMGLQREAVWRVLERSLECAVKAKDLTEKAARLCEDSQNLRDGSIADLERQVELR
jgi:hypothetical protein